MDKIGHRKHINPVASRIQAEIAREGIISFARFMEIALYDCDHGYYRKSHIGKAGDFFTSVSVGPLFGQMLAYYLAKELAGLPGPIQIVEAGANDGSLAADILEWLTINRPEFARRLTYYIVEPLPELQQRQHQKLNKVGRVPARRGPPRAPLGTKWFNSLQDLPPITGAIISNELLDAFPVRVFQWSGAEWREIGVDSNFKFAPIEGASNFEALAELKPLEPHLPKGFTVEFSPTAESWWHSAATKLYSGIMVAFDYGDESTALWSPARARGTVRAYCNHKLVDDPLADPGEQDLTASVNFSRIRAAGEKGGLISRPLQTQAQFLSKIAGEFFSNPTAIETRQFQTLTHPDHLGRAFKVFIQSRINS